MPFVFTGRHGFCPKVAGLALIVCVGFFQATVSSVDARKSPLLLKLLTFEIKIFSTIRCLSLCKIIGSQDKHSNNRMLIIPIKVEREGPQLEHE